MHTGTAKMKDCDQDLASNLPDSPDNNTLDFNTADSGRFTNQNDPRLNEIFGNNLSLQRETFMVVGVAMLVLLPLIAWGRYQLGNFHPFTMVVVLIAMASCLPAIFSSSHPKLERFAGHLLIAVLALSLLAFVVLNGGLRAPTIVTAPLLPLVAAFLLGPPAGMVMAGSVLLVIAALVTQLGSASVLPLGVNPTFATNELAALATAMFVAVVSVAAACIGWAFNRRFSVLQEELVHLATHDPLTNLANRKSLESALFNEAKKRRTTYPVSLIVLDIDHFKRFNDCHGHPAGDRVLKAVADIALTNAKRKSDVIARYGGDEFVIVLPNTSENDALQVAERLRNNVEQQRCQLARSDTYRSDTSINPHSAITDDIITLSIGVATNPPGRYGNPHNFVHELTARADAAMYRAKHAGGNRVVAAAKILNSVDKPAEAV